MSAARTAGSRTASRKRILASAFAGTTIEWYDYFLYGTASAIVFGHVFFPGASELAGVVASFSTLAVGVVVRPIGGIIAGHLGDRIGRKSLLVISLLTMGIASTLIGVLPGYAAAGGWSVAGLIVLRVIQGLSAGAEWGGSALLSVEHAPANRRGFFGSFTQIGVSGGMLLATGAIVLAQAVFTPEQFLAFGWRIPFLISGFFVLIGLWIRLGVTDAPEFEALKTSGATEARPLGVLLRTYPKPLLITAGLRLVQTSVYYLLTVYLLTYLKSLHGSSSAGAEAIMIASALGLLSGPAWGWLSDRWGRRPIAVFGIIGIPVFVWAFFAYLESGQIAWLIPLVILGLNVVHDAVYGPQAAWFAEQFPVQVRYSGVNLGYQIGTVLGGGILPMLAALLYAAGGKTPWLIAGYITVLAVFSLVAALAAKDPAGAAQQAEGEGHGADVVVDSSVLVRSEGAA
jgi:MFS family permease